MTTRSLPVAAVWLLEAFNVTANSPFLAGDLAEEFSAGRSNVWLWRQVLAAIGFAIAKELSSHKLLTIRAVITGEAAIWFGSIVLGKALYTPMFRLLTGVSPGPPFYGPFFLPLSFSVFVLGGWIVARFHRGHRTALVLLFAALQFTLMAVQVVPNLHRLLVDSIDQPRFRPYLAADMAFLFLSPIAVMLGGYLARSRGANRSSGSGLQGDIA
jgi:hypothetical protein